MISMRAPCCCESRGLRVYAADESNMVMLCLVQSECKATLPTNKLCDVLSNAFISLSSCQDINAGGVGPRLLLKQQRLSAEKHYAHVAVGRVDGNVAMA